MEYLDAQSNDEGSEQNEKMLLSAISFIENCHENGIFACEISSTRDMKGASKASPKEVGSSLLILDTALKYYPNTKISDEVAAYCQNAIDEKGRICFFEDKSIMPPDMETTAFGLSALLENGRIDTGLTKEIAEEMLQSKNKDGIIQVYFPDSTKGNRIDWVSATNIVYLLELLGMHNEASETLDWILGILRRKDYMNGSRYYESPDAFLYFLSRLLKFPKCKDLFEEHLRREIECRDGVTTFPIDVAMRVTTSKKLGVLNKSDQGVLISTQQEDGGWPSDSIYHWGRSLGYFGSRTISTGFSIEALKQSSQLD